MTNLQLGIDKSLYTNSFLIFGLKFYEFCDIP